ncbi:MAG TPA: hypothetical protein VMT64_17575, partial [Candidatus Binataceae bacterium]|nr:hypothetical protein [Candidatus Binataceae bacterium]
MHNTVRTEIHTPLDSIFHWNYDVQLPMIDRLYENAKRDQWNATTQLDWNKPIEREVLDMTQMPMFQTELYRSLSEEKKEEL